MKIVIDLSEKRYEDTKRIASVQMNYRTPTIEQIVANGTPLPKGHGRLIDADKLKCHSQIQIVPCGNGKYVEVMTYYQNDIDVAPTIIEADKENEE